jgi:hypothetical protein
LLFLLRGTQAGEIVLVVEIYRKFKFTADELPYGGANNFICENSDGLD